MGPRLSGAARRASKDGDAAAQYRLSAFYMCPVATHTCVVTHLTTLDVIFKRLLEDCAGQHPAFVVIGDQPQLLPLKSNYSPFLHTKASVCGRLFPPFQRGLALVPRDLVLLFRYPPLP